MKTIVNVLGLALLVSIVGATPSLAQFAAPSWGRGHGPAPAAEIGAGVVGMLLAGGAVAYFRRRARK